MLPVLASGFALAFSFGLGWLGAPAPLVAGLQLGAMAVAGYRIGVGGVKGLLKRSVTIDLLVTIAAVGATLIGHLEEGASVVILFSVAEWLEEYAGERARRGVEALMELKPLVAVVRRGGAEVEVPVEEVDLGEVFVLRPGSRVPLDGVVTEGTSSVDQSTMTGEPAPVPVEPGGSVFAGTLNVDGFLAARATKLSSESTLSRIQRLVEEAEESRSETEGFVSGFARWYTPAVIGLAAAVATVPPLLLGQPLVEWVYRALVLLVVACPCALAISTPVAMVSALTAASRNGVLVKGSAYIEALAKAETVAFDKTGTLTSGKLRVTGVRGSGASEAEVLACAAALEEKSEHPIARAIVEHARAQGVSNGSAENFTAHPGRGVSATLNGAPVCVGSARLLAEQGAGVNVVEEEGTSVLVSRSREVIGSLTLGDTVRGESAGVVAGLKRRGLRVEMLTGDSEANAARVSSELGLDGFSAGLLPEDKVEAVRRLPGPVVMVGDGVNDAPALAAASVGVAMGAMGSDAALETADVALLEDKLDRVPYLIDLSRATMLRVRENVAASVTVKLAVAALTVLGLSSLWMAVAVGDMGLTLLVIANSLRLSRVKLCT